MSSILYFAVPLFLITLGLEALLVRRAKQARPAEITGHERKDAFASVAMGIGNMLVSAVVQGGVLALYFWLYEQRVFEIGQGPWAWLLLFVLEDFTYYWWHRASHEVRFLWAAHVNHHSSEHYDLSTALRQSWTTPFTVPLFYWWLPLLGFHPLMILTQIALSLIYQYFLHTELVKKLGPLELVLNTPSHHRVHHGTNVEYLDRNHGGILIIWDRLFGTFEPERARVVYGLTTNIRTFNLVQIAFHEWRALFADFLRARGLHARLAAWFAPPGWSADKSSLTAHEMRAMTRESA
ncbi:MAG TPA: sterol desaturase family protein [Polyangiaceae bacterium]|nr:sterol desaturase family protein [Polyangiaceae bacterium]